MGPAQTAKTKKNKTCTRPNSKQNEHAPTLPSVLFFFDVWAGGRVFVLLLGRVALFWTVWAGSVIFVFAVWARACSLFCCLGGGRVFFFAVWVRGVCVVLLVGRVSFFFFFFFFFSLFGRGTGVHPLTGLPGSSLFKGPNNKKRPSSTKKIWVPVGTLHNPYKPLTI